MGNAMDGKAPRRQEFSVLGGNGSKASRVIAAAVASVSLLAAMTARAENLQQAWDIALGVNQQLQSQQTQASAEALNLEAAKAARHPSVRTQNVNVALTNSPQIKTNLPAGVLGGGATSGGAGAATGGTSFLFPAIGRNQNDLPISYTAASLPLYTGGRLLRNIDAAGHQFNAQRTEVARTALDLKLTVAEAYIGVLRAQRNLSVARSNVDRLSSFARDVSNRRKEGLAIRSDELAAEVSLANARLGEIRSRTSLESARSTYNRYLARPYTMEVPLEELSSFPPQADWKELAAQAIRANAALGEMSRPEIEELVSRSFATRPELAGLTEQAMALGAQADSTLSAIRPQVNISGGFAYIGAQNFVPQGNGVAMVSVDWMLTDGGVSRRRAASLRQQEQSTLQRRADAAANIALDVRTRWLDLLQSRQSVPVTRAAIGQAEENVKVILDRYRQQLSTYTEVLDAENRRVEAYNNFYNAVYDENLATYRLRRAVGDL